MLFAPEAQNMHRNWKSHFLDEPLKKTANPKLFANHHIQTLLVEFFNFPIHLSAGVKSLFIRYNDVRLPKGLSDAHFHMLVFFEENH